MTDWKRKNQQPARRQINRELSYLSLALKQLGEGHQRFAQAMAAVKDNRWLKRRDRRLERYAKRIEQGKPLWKEVEA